MYLYIHMYIHLHTHTTHAHTHTHTTHTFGQSQRYKCVYACGGVHEYVCGMHSRRGWACIHADTHLWPKRPPTATTF